MNKLLCFTAEWCNPCKAMKPTIAKLNPDRVVHYDIDVDMQKRAEYEIRSVPTFIIIDENKKELIRITGSVALSRLQELLG